MVLAVVASESGLLDDMNTAIKNETKSSIEGRKKENEAKLPTPAAVKLKPADVPAINIADFKYKKRNKGYITDIAYKFTIKNETKESKTVITEIEMKDDDGFVVNDKHLAKTVVGPGESVEVSKAFPMKSTAAKLVSSGGVKVSSTY